MSTTTTTLTWPCPAWCTLRDGAAHPVAPPSLPYQIGRAHLGPMFGDHLQAIGVEWEDRPGVVEFSVRHHGLDQDLDLGDLDTIAHDVSAAETWMRTKESEQAADKAWWVTAPNPPCATWCTRDHRPAEFADSGGLLCTRVIEATADFTVEIQQVIGTNDTDDGYSDPDTSVYWSYNTEGGEPAAAVEEAEAFGTAVRAAAAFIVEHQAVPA